FYADFNNDGQIQFGQEYLGSDWGPSGEGPNGEYQITVATTNWNLGSNRLLAFVSTPSGPTSLAVYADVIVLPNTPPTIGSLTAPATAIQGGTATLTANNVGDADPGGSVTQVSFALD